MKKTGRIITGRIAALNRLGSWKDESEYEKAKKRLIGKRGTLDTKSKNDAEIFTSSDGTQTYFLHGSLIVQTCDPDDDEEGPNEKI